MGGARLPRSLPAALVAAALAGGIALPSWRLVDEEAFARPSQEVLSVAAAANLKPAIEELERAFEGERAGRDVVITLGASGNFFAQIHNGAPFDLFLSADREFPTRLVDAGLARAADEKVYAIGKLVLWAPKDSPLDLEKRGLRAVADPRLRKLALANPTLAPYGRAAEAALRKAGVYEAVKDKLVLGQNVSQAAQFAQSGGADAALLPLSVARAPALARAGRWVAVPEEWYPRLEQSGVILQSSRNAALAREFLSFVTGPRGREILARHGYGLP
jgi:molybdate transport system substrate-binding protein